MKKTRRFASLATAAILAACAVVPATMSALPVSAADNNAITITNEDGATHAYEAYQIFKGNYSGKVLNDIQWGSGVDGDAVLGELKTTAAFEVGGNNLFKDCTTAEDVADVLGSTTGENTRVFADDEVLAKAFAKVVGNHLTAIKSGTGSANGVTDLSDGYYLVQDSAAPTNNGGGNNSGAMTRYIVKVVGGGETVELTAKHSAPSVIKKVQENTKAVTATGQAFAGNANYDVGEKYNDVADYNMGDSVSFKLYGTLPDTYDDYDHYFYQFTDTLATGLTLNVNGGTNTEALDAGDFTVKIGDTAVTSGYTVAASGNGFTLTFEDLKDSNATNVTATKSSVITVEYTATLNQDAVVGRDGNENAVKLTYSNNPNSTKGGKNDTNGETPEDKVVVFTYALDVTKYLGSKDKTANATEGTQAGFKLYNADKTKVATLDSNNKITGWVAASEGAGTAGTEVKTTADGKFGFIGLDDGVYTLVETTVPAGYNKMADQTVVISATTTNNQVWTGTASDALTALTLKHKATENADVVYSATDADKFGTVKDEIINKAGSSLPSTGGIGTTIFYVAGGVLVVGAGVLLITKKRAKDAQ